MGVLENIFFDNYKSSISLDNDLSHEQKKKKRADHKRSAPTP